MLQTFLRILEPFARLQTSTIQRALSFYYSNSCTVLQNCKKNCDFKFVFWVVCTIKLYLKCQQYIESSIFRGFPEIFATFLCGYQSTVLCYLVLICLPIPLCCLESLDAVAVAKAGFSKIREFDKLNFRVKLEIVLSLDWTEGT